MLVTTQISGFSPELGLGIPLTRVPQGCFHTGISFSAPIDQTGRDHTSFYATAAGGSGVAVVFAQKFAFRLAQKLEFQKSESSSHIWVLNA